MDGISELIAKAVPWIIPVFLIASFLVNHKTPKESGSSKTEAKPKESEKKPKPESEKKLTNKDMTDT